MTALTIETLRPVAANENPAAPTIIDFCFVAEDNVLLFNRVINAHNLTWYGLRLRPTSCTIVKKFERDRPFC